MENTEQLIAIYHTGFIVSIIVMFIGLALAVLFFFLFDIKNIFMIRTGRAKQKSIADMQQRNLQTGKLSSSPYTDSGEIRNKKERRKTGAFKTGAFKTGAFRSSDRKQGAEVQPAKQQPEAAEHLQNNGISGLASETSLLAEPNNAVSMDETLLNMESSQYEAPGTTVLAGNDHPQVQASTSAKPKFTVTERTIVTHTNEII